MADKNIKAAPGQGTPSAPANDHLAPATRPASGKAPTLRAEGKSAAAEPKDNVREIIETVVFVVVLVLLLKSFAAEAFVIPTGSMAETLWGYQRVAKCPQCGFETPVNYSKEVDPQGRPPEQITGYTCPNCRYHDSFHETKWNSGDRVLVAKFLYDAPLWVLGVLILGILIVYLVEKTPILSLLRAQQIPRGGWVRIGLCLLLLLGLVGVSLAMPLTEPPSDPHRLDVVVFKFPEEPQQKQVPTNYIKRLIGLPGETIGVYYGKLYVLSGLTYDESDVPPLDLWRIEHMHMDDLSALLTHERAFQRLFDAVLTAEQETEFKPLREQRENADSFDALITKLRRNLEDKNPDAFRDLIGPGREGNRLLATMVIHQDELKALRDRGDLKFHIIRKPPAQLLVMRRIVYDNDHPAVDLANQQPRWAGVGDSGAWGAASPNGFQHEGTEADKPHWLRYRHYLRLPGTTRVGEMRQLITDFMGYNAYETPQEPDRKQLLDWAGDLMLECEVTVEQAHGELVLQLSKGVDRFEAGFNLESGECSLRRLQQVKQEAGEEKRAPVPTPLGRASTPLSKPGTYHVRFANVDERLILWIDDKLIFGNGVDYDPPPQRGPTEDNDLEPASIGVRKAGVKVHHLRLWRDTYYTTQHKGNNSSPDGESRTQVDWSDPTKWEPLRKLPALTMYVQPGHYLCMGDNSPESSDSRYWGAVPQRLLLGRALLIYWPLSRVGRIE
jgi:signal peptidase I